MLICELILHFLHTPIMHMIILNYYNRHTCSTRKIVMTHVHFNKNHCESLRKKKMNILIQKSHVNQWINPTFLTYTFHAHDHTELWNKHTSSTRKIIMTHVNCVKNHCESLRKKKTNILIQKSHVNQWIDPTFLPYTYHAHDHTKLW